jgi:hypothetical protein
MEEVMNERPILFSAPMVRALLDGSKTQTRRIVKPAPEWVGERGVLSYRGKVGLPHAVCPHGQPGSRLWVKESIRRGYCGDMNLSSYDADGFPTKADAWPWKLQTLPSMFCPRGLSRITLEITGVRVERVQDISESDAIAEGVQLLKTQSALDRGVWAHRYAQLWDQINAKRAPWASNPWVWVLDFRRVTNG